MKPKQRSKIMARNHTRQDMHDQDMRALRKIASKPAKATRCPQCGAPRDEEAWEHGDLRFYCGCEQPEAKETT